MKSRLRTAVFWTLALIVLVGGGALLAGSLVLWPWVVWSGLLLASVTFERSAYRRRPHEDQALTQTDEVFEDPVSGKQVRVLIDPDTGERYYDDAWM